MKSILCSISCAAVIVVSSPVPSYANIVGGLVAGEVADTVADKLKDVIARAEAAGDHLIKQFAIAALEVIEGWEDANSNLLDKAFSSLDANIRTTFNNIDELSDRMIEGEDILMEDAERLTAEFANIVKSLPLTSDRAEVYSYEPKVLPAIGRDVVRFSILGPQIGAANPTALINGEAVEVERPSDNLVVAIVDRSKLNFGPDNSIFAQLRLDFDDEKPSWWDTLTGAEKNRLQREMGVWLLPIEAAQYSLKESVNRTRRETSTHSVTIGGRGKDSKYHVGVAVPPNLQDDGWRLDQDLLVAWAGGANPSWHSQGPGDHGTCSGLVAGQTSPTSFTYNIQMGHVTKWGKKNDAWAHCNVTFPIFRDVTEAQVLPAREGFVTWTDDVVLNLDGQVTDWELTLGMYDGRTYVMTPHVASPPGNLKVEAAPTQIHLRPRTPRGF